jgi:hypothetical protein
VSITTKLTNNYRVSKDAGTKNAVSD